MGGNSGSCPSLRPTKGRWRNKTKGPPWSRIPGRPVLRKLSCVSADITQSAQRRKPRHPKTNFAAINRAVAPHIEHLVRAWLPDGRRHGHEWVARNPRRHDRRPGSFSINLRTGRWADFASGDRGGDLISLAAFLFGTSQIEAARTLAATLGAQL
jgi:hypothetical protein